MRNCRLLGQECLGKTCDQYNPITGGCRFEKRISQIMYTPIDLSMLIGFFKYLEEVRPVEKSDGKM